MLALRSRVGPVREQRGGAGGGGQNRHLETPLFGCCCVGAPDHSVRARCFDVLHEPWIDTDEARGGRRIGCRSGALPSRFVVPVDRDVGVVECHCCRDRQRRRRRDLVAYAQVVLAGADRSANRLAGLKRRQCRTARGARRSGVALVALVALQSLRACGSCPALKSRASSEWSLSFNDVTAFRLSCFVPTVPGARLTAA